MENSPLSLSSLIEEGKAIKNLIKPVPRTPGAISFTKSNYISDSAKYEIWKQTVIRFLSSNYSGDRCIKDFENNVSIFEKYYSTKYFDAMLGVLASCETVPIIPKTVPSSHEGKLVNINLTQTQSQSQEQSQILDIFIEAIRDEISGKQLKELRRIIKEEGNTEKTRLKIIDKIKSWGDNIMASIIANIITNPTIWSGFMG